jgi:hypothetical protein
MVRGEETSLGILSLGWHFVDRMSRLGLNFSLLQANNLSRREDLRRRFVKAETTLFRVRYLDATISERREFLQSRDFDWIQAGTSSLLVRRGTRRV